jgi:hypothetical protein
MTATPWPRSPEEKLAYLKATAQHGDAITGLIESGAPASVLLDYDAGPVEISAVRAPNFLIVRLGPHVEWKTTLDEDDKAAGYSFSGYGVLMEALGIDFSGRPYVAGDGS